MHRTSSRASDRGAFSCFKLCISKHSFCSCTWIYWTPNPGSCIEVSCNLVTISNVSALVEIFCYDSTIRRCGAKDATNHKWCCPSITVMLASRIVLFSLWSKSQGVSPGSITIYLNLMIDCISDFDWLNSLFNASSISAIPAFGWSLEGFIYQVSAWSCSALIKVAFLILSSVTLCASHTTLTTNQNCFGSSLPTPLNIGNFIMLAMLYFWFAHRCAKANYERVLLLIQPIFNLLLHRVSKFQHQTSLKQIQVPIMEAFVVLLGLDAGSEVI